METGITYRQTLKLIVLVLLYYLLFSSFVLVFDTVSLITIVLMIILVPLFLIGYRLYSRNPTSITPICSIAIEDLDIELQLEESLTRESVSETELEPREEV